MLRNNEFEGVGTAEILRAKALAKWEELDVDGSGSLSEEEVQGLAEWIWCTFRPGQLMSNTDRVQEAAKIMWRCDENQDGIIDKPEFMAYFEQTMEAMHRFHQAQESKAAQRKARNFLSSHAKVSVHKDRSASPRRQKTQSVVDPIALVPHPEHGFSEEQVQIRAEQIEGILSTTPPARVVTPQPRVEDEAEGDRFQTVDPDTGLTRAESRQLALYVDMARVKWKAQTSMFSLALSTSC